MNIYLKSAVQNLDAHITALQEIRNQLASGIGAPVIGTEVFAPEPVQTRGRKGGGLTQRRKGAQRNAEKTGIGGGRKASSKIQNPSSREEPSAKPAEPLVTTSGLETTVSGKKVETVAGAMKLEIACRRGKEFTADELRTALTTKYAGEEWWENASSSAMSGNLSYWAKVGRLEKTDDGYQAKDAEWFKDVQN